MGQLRRGWKGGADGEASVAVITALGANGQPLDLVANVDLHTLWPVVAAPARGALVDLQRVVGTVERRLDIEVVDGKRRWL